MSVMEENKRTTDIFYHNVTSMESLNHNFTVNVNNSDEYITTNPESVRVINGFVIPSLAVIILITNTVVIAVFKRQKTYGASQAGLVGVAVSDSLTMLFPAPFYFVEYGLQYQIPCEFISMKNWISLFMPTITHTASIWLTLLLATQRYMYVCHPFTARKVCTLRNTTIVIISTYVLAVLVHLSQFIVSKVQFSGRICVFNFSEYIDVNAYLISYLFIRIILIQFVPCISLIILNAKMICGLRNITNKKIELNGNSENSSSTVKENRRVTIMIVCMAAITLLVELPVGIIQCLYVDIYLSGATYDLHDLQISERIVNLLIIFSYPLNFLLFCSMSSEFKQTLKDMCCFGSTNQTKTPNTYTARVEMDKSNGNLSEAQGLLKVSTHL
ncbi:sex peptide receptor-like [Saccostrea echinata]|uniref:sex peptide receptor-like n=1 Tax=Saccostrea echinata TaxID=191078 RepID=UPI002A819535|nr:sex peptide receptor-like [Saccostrea echinata]